MESTKGYKFFVNLSVLIVLHELVVEYNSKELQLNSIDFIVYQEIYICNAESV